jgi:hypothetical protein
MEEKALKTKTLPTVSNFKPIKLINKEYYEREKARSAN